jgi:hypothetical protein
MKTTVENIIIKWSRTEQAVQEHALVGHWGDHAFAILLGTCFEIGWKAIERADESMDTARQLFGWCRIINLYWRTKVTQYSHR